MTFWDLLITNQKSAPPEFGLWYFILPASLLVVGYFSIKYAQSKSYQRFWYWAQLIQVLTINAWYILDRLAMLAILFAPRGTYIKQYFALLGVLGSIAALVYPAFDPFPFPHITVLNLIFSHWALFANSLIYLQDFYQSEKQDTLRIVKITFGMNAVIFLVNLLTRGDYGFLRRPPIIGDHGALLNYLLVSIVMVAGICLVNQRYKYKMVEESIVSRSE